VLVARRGTPNCQSPPGRTTAPVDAVHRVLRGKANRKSNRDVADATGLTESKVQRIVKADRELAEGSA
jgi:hypothetical protein